jgi:hypothetical protein
MNSFSRMAVRIGLPLLMLSACVQLGPNGSFDASGMGDSKLAQALKGNLLLQSDELETQKVMNLLSAEGMTPATVRDTAQRIGMQCAAPPSTSCRFTGYFSFTLNNLGTADSKQGRYQYSVLADLASYPPRIRIERTPLN